MQRELTITLADDVYEGLHRKVGSEDISRYIESLLRPYIVNENDLEAAYREMASDATREQEALEWIESAPDEALD